MNRKQATRKRIFSSNRAEDQLRRHGVFMRRGLGFEPPVVPVLDPVNTRCSGVLLVSLEASSLHKRTTRDSIGHACANALGPELAEVVDLKSSI